MIFNNFHKIATWAYVIQIIISFSNSMFLAILIKNEFKTLFLGTYQKGFHFWYFRCKV